MLILYTAQSCSTTTEVISIAIYYKHWSHFLASGASKDGLGMERVNVQSGKKKRTKSFLAIRSLYYMYLYLFLCYASDQGSLEVVLSWYNQRQLRTSPKFILLQAIIHQMTRHYSY